MKFKINILALLILGIIGLSNFMPAFAEPSVMHSNIDNMSNKYANNLLRVNLVKTTDGKINLILHTTKSFENQIYPIQKSDFEYIVLLPETYHSITSKPDFTNLIEEIRDVQINLVPYIGIKTNNGYTKIIVQTKKRNLGLIISNESLELAKIIDKDIDKVLAAKNITDKTIDDITPVPLKKPVRKKTISVSKKRTTPKRKVVKTYKKPIRKATNKVVKKIVSKPISTTPKPKVEPKEVIEIPKKQEEATKEETKLTPEATTQVQPEKENTDTSKREVVQTQKRIVKPSSTPKKQSPLAGLLGNKWLYIIGIPLLLILLALRNIQKAALNQAQYDMHQPFEENEEEYYQEDDMEEMSTFENQDMENNPQILAAIQREPNNKKELQEEMVQEQEIYEEQEEPQEELFYDEEEIMQEQPAIAEPQVEVLTPEVQRQEPIDELEEISPEELEEIPLDEEIPLENRISQEEFETIMGEPQEEEFKLDEQKELFEDIEVEEEFSLDEQNDLFEDIDIQEEVLLDPEIVAKAFEEAKTKTLVTPKTIETLEEAVASTIQEEIPIEVTTNPMQSENSFATENHQMLSEQGLKVLDSKVVDVNKGLYLVQFEDQKALIGFINNEYDVLHRFKKDVINELRIKKTEEKQGEDIYLVEAKPWRALISVSKNTIKTKLIL